MACGLQPTTQILIDDFASGRKLFFSQRIGKEVKQLIWIGTTTTMTTITIVENEQRKRDIDDD